MKGQGALEYLLLIGGAVLIAAIALALLSGGAQSEEDKINDAMLEAYLDENTSIVEDYSKSFDYNCFESCGTKSIMFTDCNCPRTPFLCIQNDFNVHADENGFFNKSFNVKLQAYDDRAVGIINVKFKDILENNTTNVPPEYITYFNFKCNAVILSFNSCVVEKINGISITDSELTCKKFPEKCLKGC